LLHEFAAFWREHTDVLTSGIVYHEVAPQLVLMGYLQRIINRQKSRAAPRPRTKGTAGARSSVLPAGS
jgi:hypothetical protein